MAVYTDITDVRNSREPCPGKALNQHFADALGDGLHLERGARHLLEHLLRPHLLPLGPQLAQERRTKNRRPVAPSTAYSCGRGKSSSRESHSGSSVRCCRSIAHPSVTALSPSRFSSIARTREVLAKCSVCPASWKSARQSSGPPIGWITSMTLSGISIGAQNARGVLLGRSSRSRWTLSCDFRSIPRSARVPSSAGTIRAFGTI